MTQSDCARGFGQHDPLPLAGIRETNDERSATRHKHGGILQDQPADFGDVARKSVALKRLYQVYSAHGYLLGRFVDRAASEAAMERWHQAAFLLFNEEVVDRRG